MKKVLITGKNSYIGMSVEKWLLKEPDTYSVDTLDMKNSSWKEKNFSEYDVVFHVAGIAHVSSDPKMEELYYKVNRDLTVEVAKKAKIEGVKQFIFMSSMIIYGVNGKIGEPRVITKETKPAPIDYYGNSKLLAEKGILPLQDNNFNIVIVRPPMIYGKGSKGNYPKLAKAARKLPVFPKIHNQRSMLHIDNLSEFIKLMIDNCETGIFFPQNKEYVTTSDMVKVISETHGKSLMLTKLFNFPLKIAASNIHTINKVFGNLSYDLSLSDYHTDYRVRDFRQSIRLTESGD